MQEDFPSTAQPAVDQLDWKKLVLAYQKAHTWRSIWQLCNSLLPFIAIWVLMYLSLGVGYWLTLLLAPVAGGFLVRLFIIQHDCGHGAFFKGRKANDWVDLCCSLITWTPYHYWQRSHAIHHANAGNLEHRGIGDIYTMTVDEYLQKSWWGRFRYRLYRNPFILFVIVPIFLFVIAYRFPFANSKSMKRVHSSVYWTNLALLVLVGGLSWFIGFGTFVAIQLPIMIVSSTAGTWLFFVQHQFEDTYWADDDHWDYAAAALQGSSYYKLPKVLQWFTGNIGFHHIHHLSPRIPNYFLEKCHNDNEIFRQSVVLTVRTSLKSMFLNLWDEDQKRLISFRHLKRRQGELVSSMQ